tara:strand:- start:2689 stop:3114 length:426 start_codon:yes stop_codon:yes gene_type:complete
MAKINFGNLASSVAKKAVAGLGKAKKKPMSVKQFEFMEDNIVTGDEKRQAKRASKKQAREKLPFDTFKKDRVKYTDLNQSGKLSRLQNIQNKYLQEKNEYHSVDTIRKRITPKTAKEAAEWAVKNPATPKEKRQYERWKDK